MSVDRADTMSASANTSIMRRRTCLLPRYKSIRVVKWPQTDGIPANRASRRTWTCARSWPVRDVNVEQVGRVAGELPHEAHLPLHHGAGFVAAAAFGGDGGVVLNVHTVHGLGPHVGAGDRSNASTDRSREVSTEHEYVHVGAVSARLPPVDRDRLARNCSGTVRTANAADH